MRTARRRFAIHVMVFALLAGLAHGWLHDAHAAPRHFADHNEFCAIDKIAAVAPDTPALIAPDHAAVADAVRIAAVPFRLPRPCQQPRAPPSV